MQCTRECEGGVQFRNVECVGGQSCLLSEEPVRQQVCNMHTCTSTMSFTSAQPASSTTTIATTPQQYSQSTTVATTQSKDDLDNLKIKSRTENSSIKKQPEVNIDTTVQSVTQKHNSSKETEYYYYYYYEEDDINNSDEETESQFKWIPLTWGQVRICIAKSINGSVF